MTLVEENSILVLIKIHSLPVAFCRFQTSFLKQPLSPFVTALLLDTLKVIQRSVCNEDSVALACPRGTTISIQVAQYGKAGEEQGCPGMNNEEIEASKNCKRPNAMQVRDIITNEAF